VELDVEDATCSILVGVRAQPSQIQDLYDFVAYPPQTGWQLYSTAGNDLQNRVSFAGGTWSMPGGHHVIELTVIGPMINLTVDGDPPLNFNDVTYPSGTLALASCEHGYFDNVLVTPVK
jgi:hypothetical protein